MRRVLLPLVVFAGLLVPGPAPGASAVVSPWLETAMRQGRSDTRHTVWVYLRDKGAATDVSSTRTVGTDRARERRALRGVMTPEMTFEDRPVDPGYVRAIASAVLRVRQQSRWLNAVSVEATAAQVEALAELPYVSRVDVVKRYRRVRDEDVEPFVPRASVHAPRDEELPGPAPIDYGPSVDQLAQMRVPELHQRGLTGEGIVVAVFDSGFPNLQHEAFAVMKIAAERDFVSGLESVRESIHPHGTNTLSTLGGFSPGRLVGPAFGATFMLAVTENAFSETPVEEDNWAAAAEWAEAQGADVISSSLGYLDFDQPFASYSDRDMDGETAITTKAAARAAARGVVIVNSAGNSGLDPARNTLGAPADGKQVIAVGAVDRAGLRATFSSVGPTADGRIKPDVAALGVRAVVASTLTPQSYGFASGTSFSCPLTAGVVSLLLQAHPKYTVAQVLDAIRSTASREGEPDNLLGWGIVDAVKAVDLELPPLPAPAPVSSTGR